MVSAFSHDRGEVLGLKAMENKRESEIFVVQDLLALLDFKNVVFTMDALHCQKKTASAIVNSGNDYLITVKANQNKLHQSIATHCQMTSPIHQYNHSEKTRDRSIQRNISVFSPPSEIDPIWVGVNCVIKVWRQGTRGGQPYQSQKETYYICSLSPHSSLIPKGIRTHWHIENRLHWVKDVVLQEDDYPFCGGYAAANMGIIRTIALNLFRLNGFASITKAIRTLAHDLPRLFSFLQ